jgi:DNA-binding CsgD family transcriptional regulator
VLVGRRTECETLDHLLDAVRAGESRALVIRGEAGVGKSALLEYMIGRASGCRVARAVGVQSETDVPFAGMHQLCAPMLDRLDSLPEAQRDSIATALGLRSGQAPDRFLVGLAVLGLLAAVAEERPLLCVIDDTQWLDRASAQALGFVARRLLEAPVAVVCAVRESAPVDELAGLPEMRVVGLAPVDARALLRTVIRGPLDERVRDRIVAESRGNPLALRELRRGMTRVELPGGFDPVAPPALPGRIEDSFRRRLARLAPDLRRLLLVVAAEPTGDPVLVWRAAMQLGVAVDPAALAAAADLVEINGAAARFQHPLARSAVYWASAPQDRRSVHRALAEATDPEADADRRAWHLAHATAEPDEDVAMELERSAGPAHARGGMAAAGVFLDHAAALTPDAARRATRALAAAEAKHLAGAPRAALDLLALAEDGPLDELQRARLARLRGQIAFASTRGKDAPRILLKAAKRFDSAAPRLARDAYLEALCAALFAGRLASGGGSEEVAEAARAAPRPSRADCAPDLLLGGLAALITEGYAEGAPVLAPALAAFRAEETSRDDGLSWFWLACHAAGLLWDLDAWDLLSARFVRLARDAGALTMLPLALTSRASMHLFSGELDAAASLVEETQAITDLIDGQGLPYGAAALAAVRGREADAIELHEAGIEGVVERGEGLGLPFLHFMAALLYNSLGRYDDALVAAKEASEHPQVLWFSTLGSVELIEASARNGDSTSAAEALERVCQGTRASGSDWGLGVEALSHALLSDDGAADRLFQEATERLCRTRADLTLARAHLLYGEWLRRQRRHIDAREHLRTAHEAFAAMGAEAFGRRAARELLATGETARKRSPATVDQLTAQEAHIARLARDGLTNAEIACRLYLSPRTVEYHLAKVFTKLAITSRTQLDSALSRTGDAARTALNGGALS